MHAVKDARKTDSPDVRVLASSVNTEIKAFATRRLSSNRSTIKICNFTEMRFVIEAEVEGGSRKPHMKEKCESKQGWRVGSFRDNPKKEIYVDTAGRGYLFSPTPGSRTQTTVQLLTIAVLNKLPAYRLEEILELIAKAR